MSDISEINAIDETNLLHQFNTLNSEDLDNLCQLFIESFEHIEDPLIYLSSILNHFTTSNTFRISQLLFLLTQQYNLEYYNLYTEIFKLINEENINKYNIEFLSFLKVVLSESKISLKIIQAYIKRLMRLSLNVNSQRAYEILHFVYNMMRLYPVCFEMTHSKSYTNEVEEGDEIELENFQSYLYELDLLEWGIEPIRNMVRKIRKYNCENYKKVDKRNYLDEGYGKPINKL